MNAEIRKNLVDVLQVAEEIAAYTGTLDFKGATPSEADHHQAPKLSFVHRP